MSDLTKTITTWLLNDHDERVETGVVRPASERAGELARAVRPLVYREAAERLWGLCVNEGHGHDCALLCQRGNDVLLLEDWAYELERQTAEGKLKAQALRDAAEYIEALPPGGEALHGPYWYRSGLTDAATILRDRADGMEADRG